MKAKTPEQITADKVEFVAAREARHLTQAEWAKFLEVPYSSVTKYESKKGPAVPEHLMRRVRGLSDGIHLRLTDEMQAKLARRLAENGKSMEEYIADLLKAVLTILLLVGLVASLFHMASGASAPEAAIMGLSDAAVLAGKTIAVVASFGFEILSAIAHTAANA